MDQTSTRICSALTSRELTHSSFRLYTALVIALGGEHRVQFTEISVESLKEQIPGVRGKPLSDGVLRENLRELQRAGLIALTGAQWSKFIVRVKLLNHGLDPGSEEALRGQLLRPEVEQDGDSR